MEHENKPFSVFVKTDETGRVISINSDAFLSSPDGWVKIDQGFGDKYHHAQGNYLPASLTDDRGVYRWKLEGGLLTLRSEAEIAADIVDAAPDAGGGIDADTVHRIAELERHIEALDQQIVMLLEGVTSDV